MANGIEGFCKCGCGGKTTVARYNNKFHGRIKGQSLRFIHGHNGLGVVRVPINARKTLCWCGCGVSLLDKDDRNRLRKYLLGHWRKGRELTKVHKKRISKSNKGQTPWLKGKTGVYSAATLKKMSESRIGRKATLGERRNNSVGHKRFWAALDSTERDRLIKKALLACHARPTKPELLLESILNDLYPKEWKYVGDGQVIIGGKNPDFINVNGQKKIIEVFGDYWHRNDDPKDRINLFKKYGFKTLVVWQHELTNLGQVGKRLEKFTK